MLGALVLLQVAAAGPPLGVLLAVDDPSARAVLRRGLEEQLGEGLAWNCREAQVCLEVAAVPILSGKTNTGWAVAARFSRRLKVSPQWPQEVASPPPQPGQGVVEIIEDTTAGGEVACVPCEEGWAQCRQQLEALRGFAAERLEEVGGLVLQVGPAQSQFLRQVAQQLAAEWLRLRREGGGP
ncbi:MAG: hypothetical protein NZ869_05425 [Thermoanaerobaculum sp.]|nr:hypothetical protein [Thermoanaerobaculum sp.]MDW7967597.1 hypothetical protein [Thermoanaerobaculum sp.]